MLYEGSPRYLQVHKAVSYPPDARNPAAPLFATKKQRPRYGKRQLFAWEQATTHNLPV